MGSCLRELLRMHRNPNIKNMKTLIISSLLVIAAFLASCQKEEPAVQDASIVSVNIESVMSQNTAQQIQVLIKKPTPCHEVSSVNTSVSGTTYTYDILLSNAAQLCAQVIAEETVTVSFSPQATGEYTLNFLINGRLYETRTVRVSG
jgi:hypothetical protein